MQTPEYLQIEFELQSFSNSIQLGYANLNRIANIIGRQAHQQDHASPSLHVRISAPPAGLEPAIFGLEVRRLVD